MQNFSDVGHLQGPAKAPQNTTRRGDEQDGMAFPACTADALQPALLLSVMSIPYGIDSFSAGLPRTGTCCQLTSEKVWRRFGRMALHAEEVARRMFDGSPPFTILEVGQADAVAPADPRSGSRRGRSMHLLKLIVTSQPPPLCGITSGGLLHRIALDRRLVGNRF